MLGNRRLHLHSEERFEHKIPYCIDQARGIWLEIRRSPSFTCAHYVLDTHGLSECN